MTNQDLEAQAESPAQVLPTLRNALTPCPAFSSVSLLLSTTSILFSPSLLFTVAFNQTLSHSTFQLVSECRAHLPRRCREPACSIPSLLQCPSLIKQITGAHIAPQLYPMPSVQQKSWIPATRAVQTHEISCGLEPWV